LDDKDPNKFIAKMGAEALVAFLSRVDLDGLSYRLTSSKQTQKHLNNVKTKH
jgi:DNA-directed RNA polymerase subunit beta'